MKTQSLKAQRLVYSPTRNRRLNEMLGLVVLVAASLLLLSLLTYTATDPSLNSVGGSGTYPAHNWTGLLGAYIADLLLQSQGIAVIFLRYCCCVLASPGCARAPSVPYRQRSSA